MFLREKKIKRGINLNTVKNSFSNFSDSLNEKNIKEATNSIHEGHNYFFLDKSL